MEYLLDITTLITLISDICHDSEIDTRFGSINEWKSKNESIYNSIVDEKNNPVFPKLTKILDDNKLYATRLAWDKFNGIINLYGSNKEKERLTKLKINLVDDDVPIEFQNLTGKLWSNENKSTFGLASKNNYTLVTGNVSALSNALDLDSELKYVGHRSRCFVGKKYEIQMVN